MNNIRLFSLKAATVLVQPVLSTVINLHLYVIKPYCIKFMCLKYPTRVKPDNEKVSAAKQKLLKQMNFKNNQHQSYFNNLPMTVLLKMLKVSKSDEISGFCKNRLYYLAERLKCEPSVLGPLIAKRNFVYILPLDWLKTSLDVLLEMRVPPDRILRDLWVLKYHHETIKTRLQKVKDMGVENLYPWMVRCDEDILNRFIQISKDTKNILGDDMTTEMYLAKRLNTTIEAVEEMCRKLPPLRCIRVTKLKSFLDFLLNEGFEVKDIVEKPRVLTASQKTVQQRLEKLRNLKINPINLNVFYKSRKDFRRFCELNDTVKNKDS